MRSLPAIPCLQHARKGKNGVDYNRLDTRLKQIHDATAALRRPTHALPSSGNHTVAVVAVLLVG
jgi:hypothetical protein